MFLELFEAEAHEILKRSLQVLNIYFLLFFTSSVYN